MSSSTTLRPLRPDEDLPTDVDRMEQLTLLPTECQSGNPSRPLRHVDDQGQAYTYRLQPMSIIMLILIVETIERFAYYGVYYTQTLYLTGVYNEDWNAGFTSVQAASFVSASTAVAYTTPFIGALLADVVLGDYHAILWGATLLYLPGLLLVALTTVPHLLGEEFNRTVLRIAVLFLWPLGTGIVKSVVNVFGAKQFHPILQSSFIESYYVNFYTSINIGALVGITLIPILADAWDVTWAYMIPVVLLAVGIALFAAGTPHFVISKPRGDLFQKVSSNSGSDKIPLTTVFRISLLIVPFCVAYSQMPTTFIVQGTVMDKFFFVDAASMNSLDAVSVLAFGSFTGSILYPALVRRGIKLRTTHKFAIGSFLGALSITWALVVEHMIHQAYYYDNGRRISVLWQAPSYILIGFGEIFAVSAAYEMAFRASAPQTKALASAINIFCVGGIPNAICILLYHACHAWFQNEQGNANIQHIDDYVTAHVFKYFQVLIGILLFGIILNVLPSVSNFVEGVETKASQIVRTPAIGKRTSNKLEESPLLRKFGNAPVLNKSGSMRAGTSLRNLDERGNQRRVKSGMIPSLYGAKASYGTADVNQP